jgi:alpha-galactosidase
MAGVVEGNQGHTYGLSSWLPFQGQGVYSHDKYTARSFYMASFGMDRLTPENTAAQRKAYAECRRIAPSMLYGDYYPLTRYSRELNEWIAWQFNRPEQRAGVVQVFRRKNCTDTVITLKLHGLDPATEYEVANLDLKTTVKLSGKELMDKGPLVEIQDRPGAAILIYKQCH